MEELFAIKVTRLSDDELLRLAGFSFAGDEKLPEGHELSNEDLDALSEEMDRRGLRAE